MLLANKIPLTYISKQRRCRQCSVAATNNMLKSFVPSKLYRSRCHYPHCPVFHDWPHWYSTLCVSECVQARVTDIPRLTTRILYTQCIGMCSGACYRLWAVPLPFVSVHFFIYHWTCMKYLLLYNLIVTTNQSTIYIWVFSLIFISHLMLQNLKFTADG